MQQYAISPLLETVVSCIDAAHSECGAGAYILIWPWVRPLTAPSQVSGVPILRVANLYV